MSLYDDDIAPSQDKKGGANISMRFLQAQIAQKRSAIQQGIKNVVPPVVDLSGRNRAAINMRPLRPVKALPITDNAPLSFLPKSATDDSVLLFGEVVIRNEYQPAVPNDYIAHKRKKDEREAREKTAKDIADRLAREHKEEAKKREKGAAIAPPQALLEESIEPAKYQSDSTPATMPPPSFLPSFGKATTKGLGVAANIMSKFGYKHGGGLGRTEQGMSTALSVEKMGRNGGMIVSEFDGVPGGVSQSNAPMGVPSATPTSTADAMRHSSRILMLTNMVGPSEVDAELEPEIRDEMTKYGQVASVVVHQVAGASEDQAVRIFVEYTNIAQAIKAFVVMNGRFFAGRSVAAAFYSVDDFNNKDYDR